MQENNQARITFAVKKPSTICAYAHRSVTALHLSARKMIEHVDRFLSWRPCSTRIEKLVIFNRHGQIDTSLFLGSNPA
jgi:hypothetical protein